MWKRIVTAIFICALFVPLIVFSGTVWTVVFPTVLSFCTLLGVYELLSCLQLKKSWLLAVPLYILAAVSPFFAQFCENRTLVFQGILSCYLLFSLYAFSVVIFSHGRYRVTDVALLLSVCFYVVLGFVGMVELRIYEPAGQYLFPVVFISAWVTDTFAYFSGMLFGKHKLIPDISPKKTVEGSIGGIVISTAALMIYGFCISRLLPEVSANLWVILPLGVLLSVVSQIGDLLMSLIKRHYGVKDFGWIFPGHGGILDRFDSVIAVSATLFVFATFFNFFEVLV